MNRLIDGQNPIDRLKRKVKELEEEKDSLKFQLNESEVKLMVLNKKLKEVKLQRDWENVKFNRIVIVFVCLLTIKWFFNSGGFRNFQLWVLTIFNLYQPKSVTAS